MTLSVIVAMSENGVIGRGGQLPWHLAADLRRFKDLTLGHHLIMGRKTFDSIGRLLPGRIALVLTRQADYRPRGAIAVSSLQAARRVAGGDEEVFVVGGSEVYQLALPEADRLYVTRVHAQVEGDRCFPAFDLAAWTPREESARHKADADNDFDYSFAVYERVTEHVPPRRMSCGLVTEHLRDCQAFYTRWFGFRVVFDNAWYLHLRSPCGRYDLGLLQPGHPSQPRVFQQACAGPGVWLSLEVADAEALCERMRQAGLEIAAPLRDEDWGERHFVVHDPAGVAVNVAQRIPPRT